jgi:hypothetical protein
MQVPVTAQNCASAASAIAAVAKQCGDNPVATAGKLLKEVEAPGVQADGGSKAPSPDCIVTGRASSPDKPWPASSESKWKGDPARGKHIRQDPHLHSHV